MTFIGLISLTNNFYQNSQPNSMKIIKTAGIDSIITTAESIETTAKIL